MLQLIQWISFIRSFCITCGYYDQRQITIRSNAVGYCKNCLWNSNLCKTKWMINLCVSTYTKFYSTVWCWWIKCTFKRNKWLHWTTRHFQNAILHKCAIEIDAFQTNVWYCGIYLYNKRPIFWACCHCISAIVSITYEDCCMQHRRVTKFSSVTSAKHSPSQLALIHHWSKNVSSSR